MTLAEIKTRLVEAHRKQDWEEAKRLSQEKQKAKKRINKCIVCGVTIYPFTMRCSMHHRTWKHYSHSLNAA